MRVLLNGEQQRYKSPGYLRYVLTYSPKARYSKPDIRLSLAIYFNILAKGEVC